MMPSSARLLLAMILVLGGSWTSAARADIRDSVHNLSVSGVGVVSAESETRICIFCHTPHRASQGGGVLWNRADSTATYIPYQSATLRAAVGQPTGASKMCLSCHDGTVALGQLLSEPTEIGFVGGVRLMPPGTSHLGTDLSDDHPISFNYEDSVAAGNLDLVDPSTLNGAVKLDQFGEVQCTSCHDPHDTGFGKFLVATTESSLICLTCHDPAEWSASSHATSAAIWNGMPPDPWEHTDFTSVTETACENCHRPHSAGSSQWILNFVAEEDNCLVCHNGNVAATDIQAEITLPFRHPVEMSIDIHTPIEDPSLPMTSHVECTDCHNPHKAVDTPTTAPLASGALRGASGISQSGQPVEEVAFEYEVCYKCHSEFSMTDPAATREHTQPDKLLQFDVTNPSFHPVVGIGVNPLVPSLLPPLTTTSQIFCTDCHSGSNGPGAGGTGPAGPHGSINPFILERQYNTLDGVAYFQSLYDMCFKCHSATSILDNESFREHKKHIEGEDTPCGVCHDPHGISSTQGNDINNSNLINFDLTIVSPEANSGLLEFEDRGVFQGSCTLACHGKEHENEIY
jgi:predicted CXXCH cytochrome family protein